MTRPTPTLLRRSGRGGLRLLVVSPRGAGTPTRAELVSGRHGIPAVSARDVFRSQVAAGTPLGVRVQHVLASGGYPRTRPQVDALGSRDDVTHRTLTALGTTRSVQP